MIGKLALLAVAAVVVFAILFFVLRSPTRNTKIVVAAIAVVAIGAPLLYALQLYTAHELASRYVSEVGRAFGISSYWSAAIASLLVVPILLAFGLLFSLSAERRLAGKIVLSLGLAAYWGSLGLATSGHMVAADGGRLKCYTIGQDGVRFFEQEQVDPRTGERCRWIDESNVQTVLAIDRKLKSGAPLKRLEFNSMAEVRFFAPGTDGAVPLVWYYRAVDGSYEFFDAPGPHPIYGEPLKPVMPEVAKEWASRANLPYDRAVDPEHQTVRERQRPEPFRRTSASDDNSDRNPGNGTAMAAQLGTQVVGSVMRIIAPVGDWSTPIGPHSPTLCVRWAPSDARPGALRVQSSLRRTGGGWFERDAMSTVTSWRSRFSSTTGHPIEVDYWYQPNGTC